MKPYIITLLFFTILLNVKFCEAQDSRPQIRFKAGKALVKDDFGDKNTRNRKAGLAEDGLNFGIAIVAPAFDYLDVTFELSASGHALDAEPIRLDAKYLLPDFQWTISDGTYEMKNAFIGARFYYGNRFKVYFNPSFGFAWVNFPVLKLEGTFIDGDDYYYISSQEVIENSRTPTYSLAAGIDYLITKNLGISVQVERLKYDFDINSTVTVESTDPDNQNVSGTISHNANGEYSAMNYTLGLVLKFDWKEEE
jgi:hypothetical protein